MAEVVLARPGFAKAAEKHWGSVPPLGLGYLAACAKNMGCSVAVVDGKMEGHLAADQTVEVIRKHEPQVVGLSAMTIEYPRAQEIARQLKQLPTRPTVILGGIHANALPEESLLESPEIDYVMAGESEASFPQLLAELRVKGDFDSIHGLYRRQAGGSIRKSSAAGFVEDLGNLPFPAWGLFPRSDTYPVMTERGCPYHCVFCSRNMMRKVRVRPIEHVMQEMEWLHRDFSPNWINFEDETFGLHFERSQELLVRLIEFNRNANIIFKAQTRVDKVTDSLVGLMKKAGFHYLELGVESGDPEVLKRSGKEIRLDQVENAVKIARNAGIKVWLKFIIGLPGETKATVRRSINLAAKLNPNRLSVALIVAYPGSDIFTWARQGENGYTLVTNDWNRFDKYLASSVELTGLSRRTMRRLQIQMYLETYLRNSRLKEFLTLLWRHRALPLTILGNVFTSRKL